MKTTVDFLDALRAELRLTSDYQLAKALGVRPQHLSRYRTGKHTFDEEMAIRVAGLLKLDPGHVLACVQAERAKNDVVRKAWSKAAKALAGTAVAILAGCTLAMAPLPHLVPTASAAGATVYYVKWLLALIACSLTCFSHFRTTSRRNRASIAD